MNASCKRWLVAVLCAALCLGTAWIAPASADTTSRDTVYFVFATSNLDSIVQYGAEIVCPEITSEHEYYRFTVPSQSGYTYNWQEKYAGEWRTASGTFMETTYRFRCQVRIDGAWGREYVLDYDVYVYVDDVRWTLESTPVITDNYSYVWIVSPEFVVRDYTNVPLMLSGEATYEIPYSYVKKNITSFSVADAFVGGQTPYTFSKQSGPDWLQVSQDGTISGAPTAVGSNQSLVVRVTDAAGSTSSITIPVEDTVVNPEDRVKVSLVTASSNFFDILQVGADVNEVLPEIYGVSPSCVTFRNNIYLLHKDDDGDYSYLADNPLPEGVYRFEAEIRINGREGRDYMLSLEDLIVRIDGVEWDVLLVDSFCGSDYSSARIVSPDFSVGSQDILYIVTQPQFLTVAPGKTAAFSVEASGATGYQWYYHKPDGSDWIACKNNGTSATYSLTAEERHNGYWYRCQVIGRYGSVYSNSVRLTVLPKPAITTQPESTTVIQGQKASFWVVCTNAESYQWYYKKPGETTWNKCTRNGTSSYYSVETEARHNGYQYRCKVKNSTGTTTSKAATLTVLTKPAFTAQPANQSVVQGQTATFTVVATGERLSYQWYFRKPGTSSWSACKNNGTSASYSVVTEARHNGYQYRCKVTNAAGSTTSSAATLAVTTLTPPVLTTQPGNKSVVEGKTATFKVVASGEGLSYQWYYQKPGESTWNKCKNSGTSASYSVATEARHNGYHYQCVITNEAGSVTSNAAKLTVKPGITTQPASVTVTKGQTATFTVVATGTGLTYQWYYQKPGETTWNACSNNGTSATYSVVTAARHNGYSYRCKVTNSGDGSVYTSVATLTVK